jgi:hypothetical protein
MSKIFNPDRNRDGEQVRSLRIDDEVIRRGADFGNSYERRAARRAARAYRPNWQAESLYLRAWHEAHAESQYRRDWDEAHSMVKAFD